MESKDIYDQINNRYSIVEKSSTGQYEHTVATAFGYKEEELSSIPDGSNLGLSCGNPLVLAKLREGEIVIDLGSGAGFDVFLAAKRVGQSGKVIGVDMNKAMIEKANINKAKANIENVEFVEGVITAIPLPDNTADCIISNCVINLVPIAEKQFVFNEMYRLLKPGGRVAVSDILARKEMTKDMKENVALYVGCISGASQVSEYNDYLEKAGFKEFLMVDSESNLNVYLAVAEDGKSCCESVPSCCSTEKQAIRCEPDENENLAATEVRMLPSMGTIDLNEWAGSFQIYAVKPRFRSGEI